MLSANIFKRSIISGIRIAGLKKMVKSCNGGKKLGKVIQMFIKISGR